MAVEQAIPREDGSVERWVFPGDGQAPQITEFDTDEMLLMTRASEQRAERWQRIKRPIKLIQEKIIGALDTTEAVRAEQLAKEAGSHTLLEHTIEGWRHSGEANNA